MCARPSSAAAKAYVSHLQKIESAAAKHFAKPGPPTANGTNAEDRAWLDRNKAAPGVITLPCGLQYKVLRNAKTGSRSPKIDTPCEVHYKGTLLSGSEFHCSYAKASEPERHLPSKCIQGWTVALMLMGVGDKWLIWVPSELAYGDTARGEKIPACAALAFEMELIAVRSDNAPPKVVRPAGLTTEDMLALLTEASSKPVAATDEDAKSSSSSSSSSTSLMPGPP